MVNRCSSGASTARPAPPAGSPRLPGSLPAPGPLGRGPQGLPSAARRHGGPDWRGPLPDDFSTGAHPGGPCPVALKAIRAADFSRYPDPAGHTLREQLAAHHGVDPRRLVLAGSASEFIQRISAVAARLRPGTVWLPRHAYADYALAAAAVGLPVHQDGPRAGPATGAVSLRWLADPGSPDGAAAAPPPPALAGHGGLGVLDRAYAPLRLLGPDPWRRAELDQVFQLLSPNKALGLCGVRAAYAIAPAQVEPRWLDALRAAEPSWPVGAAGVAMLLAWCTPEAQAWLASSLEKLRRWRGALVAGLLARGFEPRPGQAPFVCARLPRAWRGDRAERLRAQGIAVRDATSFGLPGHWRLNALSPAHQARLWRALDAAGGPRC